MHSKINLPYELNSFEPTISKDTMSEHYNKLYTKYVDDYNTTITGLENARSSNNYEDIKCLEKDLSFNASGVVLHELYFNNITPNNSTTPSNKLNECIKKDFGSFENFKQQFSQASLKIEGGGWCILAYTKTFDKLEIITCEKHQNLCILNSIPILTLDMWEHSYYLDHKTDKNKYIQDFFNMINFDYVNNLFEQI